MIIEKDATANRAKKAGFICPIFYIMLSANTYQHYCPCLLTAFASHLLLLGVFSVIFCPRLVLEFSLISAFVLRPRVRKTAFLKR